MIRRPPRSTQGVSSAASDVYKRQELLRQDKYGNDAKECDALANDLYAVSYTHLRAHET